MNPRKRKAPCDDSEFVFNINDQYGSEFEDPDISLNGGENTRSETLTSYIFFSYA